MTREIRIINTRRIDNADAYFVDLINATYEDSLPFSGKFEIFDPTTPIVRDPGTGTKQQVRVRCQLGQTDNGFLDFETERYEISNALDPETPVIDQVEFLLTTSELVRLFTGPYPNTNRTLQNLSNWSTDQIDLLLRVVDAINVSGFDIFSTGTGDYRVGKKINGNNGHIIGIFSFLRDGPRFRWTIHGRIFHPLDANHLNEFIRGHDHVVMQYRSGDVAKYETHGATGNWPNDYIKYGFEKDIENSSGDHTMNLNTILFGPPGTGKTHSTVALALAVMKSEVEHSSKAYAKAVLNESPLPPLDENDWTLWTNDFDQLRKDGRIEFTTFHQNYSYEDFIEGLQAKAVGTPPSVTYSYEMGVLKRLAYRALHEWLTGEPLPAGEDKSEVVVNWLTQRTLPAERRSAATARPYLLIIDEINRGNVARIFGEIITLVEDSKRAVLHEDEINVGHQPIYARLPYTKESFILPPNLYILGTMNTADRSLIGLDAALRRRFEFIELAPKPELLGARIIDGINLKSLLEKINSRIVDAEQSHDHQIGHAYFLNVKSIDNLANVMKRKVIPQLQEYFYDSPRKIAQILATGPDTSAFVNDLGKIEAGSLMLPQNYISLCNNA